MGQSGVPVEQQRALATGLCFPIHTQFLCPRGPRNGSPQQKGPSNLQTLTLFLSTPPYWSFPSSGSCWPVVKEHLTNLCLARLLPTKQHPHTLCQKYSQSFSKRGRGTLERGHVDSASSCAGGTSPHPQPPTPQLVPRSGR